MAVYTKTELKARVDSFFPDNTSRYITPSRLREICDDIIDSYDDVGSEITGGGTAGKFVKWISASEIADSIMSESGSVVSVTGSVNISALTASRVVVTDASKNLISSTVTATEIGYVSGVTSAIQTQLNTKEGTITTLPVSKGGTGTSTAFTAGSVVFAGASGVYSQKNSNLFWDNTNNYLGIGTATPAAYVSVVSADDTNYSLYIRNTTFSASDANAFRVYQSNAGAVHFSNAGNASMIVLEADGQVTMGTTTNTGQWGLDNNKAIRWRSSADVEGYGQIYLDGSDSFNFNINSVSALVIDNAGNIGVGVTTPLAPFHLVAAYTSVLNSGIRVEGPQPSISFANDGANSDNRNFTWINGLNSPGVLQLMSSTSVGENVEPTYQFVAFDAVNERVMINIDQPYATLTSTAFLVNGGACIGVGDISVDAPTNGLLVGGDVGIGLSGSPSEALHIEGNILMNSNGNKIMFSAAGCDISRPVSTDTLFMQGADVYLQANTTGVIVQTVGTFQILDEAGADRIFYAHPNQGKIAFFGVTAVVRQTGGAATAGAVYTATEQGMLEAAYSAMRNYGLLT